MENIHNTKDRVINLFIYLKEMPGLPEGHRLGESRRFGQPLGNLLFFLGVTGRSLKYRK